MAVNSNVLPEHGKFVLEDLSTGVELFLKEDGMVEKETDSDTFYNAMETLS